jgi:hypothetical protein
MRGGKTLQVLAAIGSLLVVAGGVVRSSSAAFSDPTDNPGNTFAAGDVVLTDDDGGASSMFAMSNMRPGSTATKCINVSYEGSVNSQVRMYGAVTAGTGLADYLDVTVERSTGAAGGATADCTGFNEGTKVNVWTAGDGDLDAFMTGNTDYATGADSLAVTGGAPIDTVSYRIVITLQDNNAAQTKGATVTFTWEAQSV